MSSEKRLLFFLSNNAELVIDTENSPVIGVPVASINLTLRVPFSRSLYEVLSVDKSQRAFSFLSKKKLLFANAFPDLSSNESCITPPRRFSSFIGIVVSVEGDCKKLLI